MIGGAMKDLLAIQFKQFWRMFQGIVHDYPDEQWTTLGHGMTMPMMLAYHILHSIRYYIHDTTDCTLSTGRAYQFAIERVDETNYLQRNEIQELASYTSANVNDWIETIDLEAENSDYHWTGQNMLSVMLLIIRHSYYHLGELNTLLNEHLKGGAKDNFAINIY